MDLILLKSILGIGIVGLVLSVLLPLGFLIEKAFESRQGAFVGLTHFYKFFATPNLAITLSNSLLISCISTVISVMLAFLFAYGLTRANLRCRNMLKSLALLPFLAPSLLPGLSLVYIFGNQGIFKSLLFGQSIYGPIGIIAGEVFYTFPHAFLILSATLSIADGRLYEAAQSLNTPPLRIFWTITFPEIRYGLVSALFVVFTLVIVDFGIPKIIGGQYPVLATEIYQQVIGQQNFQMGAVVSIILLIPSGAAFLANERVRRRQLASYGGKSTPLRTEVRPAIDRLFFVYCWFIAGTISVMIATAIYASFINLWPYDLSLSFAHYRFESTDGGGWQPFFNSVQLATYTGIFGTAIVFVVAYVSEKITISPILGQIARLIILLPMAIPGMALGLGYIFFFNHPNNPFHFLYGTMAILVIATIAHFYTVGHLTASVALKQLDREFEAVAQSLKVPLYRLFFGITAPLCRPVITEIGLYFFVNAMTTLSAVVFLYSPKTILASVAAINMDDSGEIAAAAAMCTLIFLTNVFIRGLCLFSTNQSKH